MNRPPPTFDEADDRLMTPEEAARFFGIRPCTLKAWRAHRKGPAYVTIGHSSVRYRLGDLHAYVEANVSRHGGAAS